MLPEDVSLSGKVGVSHLCEEIFEEESEWSWSRNDFEKLDAKQRRAKGPKIHERGIQAALLFELGMTWILILPHPDIVCVRSSYVRHFQPQTVPEDAC